MAGLVTPGLKRWSVETVGSIINEAGLQEPLQGVIETAAKRTLLGGGNFYVNLLDTVKEYTRILAEVGPETALSTLMTQMATGGAGAAIKKAREYGIRHDANLQPKVNDGMAAMAALDRLKETEWGKDHLVISTVGGETKPEKALGNRTEPETETTLDELKARVDKVTNKIKVAANEAKERGENFSLQRDRPDLFEERKQAKREYNEARRKVAPEYARNFEEKRTKKPAKEIKIEGVPVHEGSVAEGAYHDLRSLASAAVSHDGLKMGKSLYMDFAPISDKTADRVKEKTGLDVHGMGHAIDGSGIYHILKGHGEDGQRLKDFQNQIPLTIEDVALIPDVVENADNIEPGSRKNRVLFKKRVDGHIVVVEGTTNNFGKLMPVTAWKEKVNNKGGGLSQTSETSSTPSGQVSAASPHGNTIPQAAAEVKEAEAVKTIPEGAKLKGGNFTVHYEGSTGPMDYEIRAKPWEKHNKRYIYLDELREGNTPKPVGYYDVSKDKFVKKKDNFFVDEVEKEFRKRLGDFFEQPNPKTGLREITIDLSPKVKPVVPPVREEKEETPKAEGTITPNEPQAAKSPSMTVAERVADHIGIIKTGDTKTHPAKIETKDLTAMADKAFGGTMAEGKYSIKDAYDALEMGVNKSIQNGKISPSDDINDIARDLDKLRIMEAALPTQAKRTEEQNIVLPIVKTRK